MKIGVIGHKGFVGRSLVECGAIPIECDITNKDNVDKAITQVDVIALLASKSDVEFCEDVRNVDIVLKTNLHGPYHVFQVAEKLDIPVAFISTDHVFDGKRWRGGYKENDKPLPVNFYGMSKLAAEGMANDFSNVKIVRTSTLFQRDMERIRVPLYEMGPYQKSMEFPTFINRSFMYVPHFAGVLMQYLHSFIDMPKILNISGSIVASWYDFMSDLASDYHIEQKLVRPRKNEIKNEFAPRPKNGGLDVYLSKKLRLQQYSYLDGLTQMRKDEHS